ncbi:MAG: hypothetical protein EZS28_012831 [Streblomastix strix]|uniref:Uncharacterized protein n=1 Tax=Streblomastix strix TaxID=222440 RepID=A0A5J4WAG2_9EUKA|nr:MAG: hypothetical protein EZS28_012831 [Streblomastix strix]
MLGNKHGQVSHQSYQGSSSGDENAPIQVEIKLDLQRAIQLLNREKRRADDEAEVIALLRMELERERRNKGLPTEEEYQIELQRIIEKEKRTFKKEMDILRNEISVLQTALIEENQKKEKALQDVYILAELKQNTELQLQKAVTNRKNVEQRTTNEKEKCLAIESERDAAVISSEKEKQKAIILETEIEQLNEKIQQKEQELLKVLQERQIEQRLTAETLDEIQSERKRQDDQNDALQQNVSELKQQIELIGKQHENEKKNLYNQIREELEKQIPEEQQNEIDELRKAIQETSQELRELRQQYEDEKFNRERADNQKKEVEDQLETMRKDMEKLINYADEYKEKEDELNQELNNIKQKYDQLSKESQAMEKTMSQSYRQLQETTSQQLQAQSEKSIEIQRENDRLKSEMKKIEQNEVQYQKEIGQTKKENSIQKQEKEKEWLKREQQLQSEIDKLIGENEDMKNGTQYELTEEKKKKEEERWAIMRERERMKDEIRLKDEQILSIMKDNEQQNKDKERMNNEIIEREMKYQEDKQKEEEEIIKLEDLIEQKEREYELQKREDRVKLLEKQIDGEKEKGIKERKEKTNYEIEAIAIRREKYELQDAFEREREQQENDKRKIMEMREEELKQKEEEKLKLLEYQNERSKPVIQSNARARLAELLRTPAIFYPEERRQNININQRSVVNSGINPRTSLIGANLQSQISISPPPHTSETSPIHKSPHNSPPRPTQFPITLDSTQTITIKTSPESKNTFVRTITSSPSHINMNYDNLNSNIDKERGRSIDKIGSNVRTSPERSEISNENRKVSFSSSYTTGGSKNISQIRSLSPSNSISQNQQSPIHKSPHNSPPRPTQFPITLDSTQTITIKTSPESKNTFVRTITSSPSHINMNYDNLNSNIAGSPKFNNQQQFGKDKERGRSIDRIGSIVRTSPERSDILNENRKVTFSSQYATTGGSTSSIQLQQVYSPFSTVVGSVQQKQVTSTLFFNKPISLSSPPRSYSQPSYQQQSYNYQSTLQQQSSPHMSHPLKAPDSPKKPEFDKLKPSNPHDE